MAIPIPDMTYPSKPSAHRYLACTLLLFLFQAGCDGCTGNVSNPCSEDCAEGTYCCHKTSTCEPVKYNCTTNQTCQPGFDLEYGPGPYMNEATCEPLPLECSCVDAPEFRPGIIGRFSALAAHGGQLYASAYESTFGDLVLVTASISALDSPSKEIVDGVPNIPPVKDPQGWRGGVDDVGDDLGLYTDIVIDSTGSPMISYLDKTNRSLKFAQRSGSTWTSHTVDSPSGEGEKELIGRYTALTLLEGKPCIAYLAMNIDSTETPGSFHAELRWACAGSTSPAAKEDWTISIIESKAMPCQNLCSSSQACVLNGDGSSSCQDIDPACTSCSADEACVAAACVKIIADTSFEDIPQTTGTWPCLTSIESGVAVFYHDRTAGTLKGAIPAGEAWNTVVVHQIDQQQIGAFCSAQVDSNNTIHLSYQNLSKLSLHYAQVDATTLTPSLTEIIDDGLRTDGPHPVGADSAIVVDSSGTIRVIYQDAQTADLLMATRSGADSWTPQESSDTSLGRLLLGGNEGFGFYSDLVVEGGAAYGSTFFYDPNANPKGGLVFFSATIE